MALRFFPAISLLLVSQAFWAAAAHDQRLIRAVSASGAIKESDVGEVGKMSVSSIGEIETFSSGDDDKGNATEDELINDGDLVIPEDDTEGSLFEDRHRDLLAEVEGMMQSNDPSQREKIAVIKDLVKNKILPELQDDRDKAEAVVNTMLKAIDTCNTKSGGRQKGIKDSNEASVTATRSGHASCRVEEKAKESDKNGECGKLDTFLANIKSPGAKPSGRDGRVKYVAETSTYWCPQGPEVNSLDDACKKTEKAHREHKADCERKQDEFEMNFCVWRTKLVDECDELATCYEDAVKAYNDFVESTKKLVKRLKLEHNTLTKIVCYTDVWMSDSNSKTVDSDQYEKCKNLQEPDPSPMEIDFGTVPAKTTCDLAPVETHPGTTNFPSVEYSKFDKYADTPMSCPPTASVTTSSVTEAPTTAAPTTPEPTAAPTPAPTPAPKPIARPGRPGGAWYAAHGNCRTRQFFKVAVAYLVNCPNGKKAESHLSPSLSKDFIHNKGGCYHKPMFQYPGYHKGRKDPTKPAGLIAYRWYVETGGKWYMQQESANYNMQTRNVKTSTPYGALPSAC